MYHSERIKKFLVFLGDAGCFYLSLFLMLAVRFGLPLSAGAWKIHFGPFSIIFGIWAIVFYVGHLYELGDIQNKWQFFRLIFEVQAINLFLAVVFFYLYPTITPKTNLALVIIFSFLLVSIWRLIFNKILMRTPSQRVLILGGGDEVNELKKYLDKRPQLGYQILATVSDLNNLNGAGLTRLIEEQKINTLVVARLIDRVDFRKALFDNLFAQVSLFDLAEFYEMTIKKIPISVVDEVWFLANLRGFKRRFFEASKRIFDFMFSAVCLAVTLPFWPLIAILIKLDSKGRVFHTHQRIGLNGKSFTIIKFRTMVNGADKNGPHWTEKNDKRITHLGKFLRKTHIDELPQFINILKGDVSFVGPRPEEKELVDLYSKEIPFYQVRHLAKPGMIGWAQLNYPHGASVEDAIQKLQYDFYYLKNRTFWLDLSIVIRVIRIVLTQPTH